MLLEFDGTFIFALISFIIFVILMNLILYRPIMKIIDERQKFFDKNKNTVLLSKQKSADVLKNMEDEILAAKLKASDILSDNQNNIKIEKDIAIKDKKEEIKGKMLSYNASLIAQKNEADTQLKSDINNFVKMTVSKILETDVENLGYSINIEQDKINKIMEDVK